MPYFLRTRRLGLRHWRDDDIALAQGLWGDPLVTRLIDARGPLSAEQVRERLDREIANQKFYAIQYWPVFLVEDGTHVGCCGLRPRARRTYELGFHIRSALWGRGFAFEAAQAVVGYAFDALGARELVAGHNPENVASRRVLEKLGFTHTGDEYYPPTGLQHPSYVLRGDS
ncbi:MAG TPA: GNAT family N-acetyltransferase [Usitatibacter sp.]|nr:GNAT family N-acetyltransferase [Usitatibacter sp.]